MKKAHPYKPFHFFFISFLVTWVSWFAAAVLSHHENRESLAGALMGLGLLGPLLAALIMVFHSKNQDLKQDFNNKLFNIILIKPAYWPVIFILMPLVMVLSIVLSLLIGQTMDQLKLTSEFTIMSGRPLLSLIIPFLAPALEELGWSGYGIDSLKSRFNNVFNTSIVFGALWALWHLPLFFIKGYYHANLLNESIIYAGNFFLSVIPLTIITNWLYFKNGRSMIAAILFHVVVVISSEMFLVVNQTKCIVTIVLTMIAIAIIMMDKAFFFESKKRPVN